MSRTPDIGDRLTDAVKDALADIMATVETSTDATPEAASDGRRTRWVSVAAALVVLLGALGLWFQRSETSERSADSSATTAMPTPPETPSSSAAAGLDLSGQPDQGEIRLPPPDVVPSHAQRTPAQLDTSRAAVATEQGVVFGVGVGPNSWGEITPDMDVRTLGSLTWATMLEGDRRTYVAVDGCRLINVIAPRGAQPWGNDAVSLLGRIEPLDAVNIELPVGWATIASDSVGDRYTLIYDSEIEGAGSVMLTQSQGNTAGPLLYDLSGAAIEQTLVGDRPAWRVQADESGWHHLVWEDEYVATMLSAKSVLTPAELADVLSELTPSPTTSWDERYEQLDVGNLITSDEARCAGGVLTIE